MAKRIAWSPDNQRILTKNGRICTSCCFLPEFSIYDCPIFTDPSPTAWSSGIIYKLHECVSHSGQNYYSTTDNNIGHEPGTDDKWTTYTSCGNSNWNSYPPFGGIGRTPAYYALSSRIEQDYVYTDGYYGCSPALTRKFIVEGSAIVPQNPQNWCSWGGNTTQSYYYNDILDFPTCSKTPDVQYDNPYPISVYLQCSVTMVGFYYPTWRMDFWGENIISGTRSRTTETQYPWYTKTEVWTMSWRPVDCIYSLWKDSTDYKVNDCVTWLGRFFKACLASGPNNGGSQEPSVDAPGGCTGVNYWRIIE